MVTSELKSHTHIQSLFIKLEKSLVTEKINLAFVTRYFLVLTCNNEITLLVTNYFFQ